MPSCSFYAQSQKSQNFHSKSTPSCKAGMQVLSEEIDNEFMKTMIVLCGYVIKFSSEIRLEVFIG